MRKEVKKYLYFRTYMQGFVQGGLIWLREFS